MKAEQIRKVHCLFEQSGTFKNEFIKLGIPAEDYDIQNNFNQTDHVIDLFAEIDKEYNNLTEQNRTEQTIFSNIDPCQDIVMAFFPCIYFTGWTNPCYFTLGNINYRSLTLEEKLQKMTERADNRNYFFKMIIKLVGVCLIRNIKLVIENPAGAMHYLEHNFFKAPDIVDYDRTRRGDYCKKPTQYWFFNFKPSHGASYQKPDHTYIIADLKGNEAGICSEERSLISPDYARNFICDFILGKKQEGLLQSELF